SADRPRDRALLDSMPSSPTTDPVAARPAQPVHPDLPVLPSAGAAVTDAPAIRVLIVDDHSVVRMGLRMFFELQPDIEVVGEATDGSEGVAMARRLEP